MVLVEYGNERDVVYRRYNIREAVDDTKDLDEKKEGGMMDGQSEATF